MKRFLVHQVVEIGLLLVFIDCQDMRQVVAHVSIFGRIVGYGDNLTLICTLDKNLQSPIDNKRWYIDDRLTSINNKTNDPEKYKAQIIPDGVQLTILNFLPQDINKLYSCIIGFYQSEKLNLSESDVFRDEMINSKDDKNSDYIDPLVPVVVVALVALGLIIIACRKKILCIKGNKEKSLLLEMKPIKGDKIDEVKQEDILPADEESDEKSLLLEMKPIKGNKIDEVKQEDISPADEESDAISSDLERTSVMNNKKNARKNQDISATDDQSSKNVVNDQKDEGKIEKLSPADEKRSAISSDLERTSVMNNKKNARKNQDISATDDQSSNTAM